MCPEWKLKEMRKLTQKQFISDCNITHNWKYNYDKTVYVNTRGVITITCPIHGDFKQEAGNHKKRAGCNQCGMESQAKKTVRYTPIQFIKKVQQIHPNLDFSKTVYLRSSTKVIYTCPIHGDSNVMPHSLLSGSGCRRCSGVGVVLTKKEWLNRFKKLGFSNVLYHKLPNKIYSAKKVNFFCKTHGDFWQTPHSHYKGHNCQKCAHSKLKDTAPGWANASWEKAALKSKLFDSFKVYVIKCSNENETFYKVGKTFTTIRQRFKSKISMPYDYKVVKKFEFENSKDASNLELKLKTRNKRYRYTPLIKFGGMNECFKQLKQLQNLLFNT